MVKKISISIVVILILFLNINIGLINDNRNNYDLSIGAIKLNLFNKAYAGELPGNNTCEYKCSDGTILKITDVYWCDTIPTGPQKGLKYKKYKISVTQYKFCAE